ncbi:pentatricopeptide repeat-containing protein At3g48250, chloroplastic [Cynara cardunculus var. scolymus]|nr:pentatricopeptide repeat-containing protein At3g48250, chloroplastic [Cynara cardunculus var. scolymus]
MNLTKRLLSSIKLANSLYSTQLARTHLHNQVRTRVLHLYAPTYVSPFHNFHGRLFFSSKPEQILNLILSENWSEKLEDELSNSKSDFTHESVMYVLKKLSKDPKKASDFFNWIVGKLGFQPSSSMYSLMLRIYGNKESIKQLWITAQKMKEGGFFIDDQAYLLILRDFKSLKMVNEAALLTKFYNSMMKDDHVDDLVDQIVGVLIESNWGNGVEKRLEEMKFGSKLSDNFILRVLKNLRSYPLKALGFFKWVSDSFDYEHNTVTYNAILRVLGREDSLEEFWSTFNEMKNVGHKMDLDTYLKITRLFQKRKMFKEAVDLYEQMMDSPYKPSIQDCSQLLRNIAGNRSPDLDLVFRVVNKFKETGNSLSKSVYDGIHRSLTSVGQFDEAEKMMTAMKEAGYEPDNITYSQLIFGLCKARRLEEASNVIDLMESNGCIPDIKTWTILIQGHCSANEVEKALIFLANMIEKGCEADADLLDVLINGFLHQENAIAAHQLLTEMVESGGVKPWQATYKNLIQKLLAERKIEESLEVLRLMRKHGYPPFSEAFVGYLSKFGTIDECLEFLKALSVKESPSISAYQNMFQGMFDEGREMEAKDLLFKCPPHIRKHKALSSLFGSVGSFVV